MAGGSVAHAGLWCAWSVLVLARRCTLVWCLPLLSLLPLKAGYLVHEALSLPWFIDLMGLIYLFPLGRQAEFSALSSLPAERRRRRHCRRSKSSITLSSLAPETLPPALLLPHPSSFLLCFSSTPPSSLLLFFVNHVRRLTRPSSIIDFNGEQLFLLSNRKQSTSRTCTPQHHTVSPVFPPRRSLNPFIPVHRYPVRTSDKHFLDSI